MHLGNIVKYGVYNSKKKHGNSPISPVRTVACFEFDFILACDSSATSYIDDKSCKLVPNMLIIRKPNQKSNSILHFKCYCLHLEVERDNPIFYELMSTPEYFTFINESKYRVLFETLLQHLTKNAENLHDHFTTAKILELIYHIKKDEKYNQTIRQTALKKENRSIQKAVSFMKKHYDQPIALCDLGKIGGYSPNHFQRLFVEVVGISPNKYLENIRINRAKYLLMENELSLSDIAYKCGFSSQSYFSKVFKKHTLLTPYEFQSNSAFKYLEEENE